MTKTTEEGKCVLHLTVYHPEKSEQELKAGTDGEAVEECCLLGYSSLLVQPGF